MKTKTISEVEDQNLNQDGEHEYCVYTDSVPDFEPVVIKNKETGLIDVRPVSELEDDWADFRVWSDGGFVDIEAFIKKPVRKKLYTVRTREGCVHVTEDHSLLTDQGVSVSPEDVKVGETELLHKTFNGEVLNGESDISQEHAWLLGFFVAEGSCGTYETDYGRKHSWAISNQDITPLKKSGRILQKEFGVATKIDEVMESSNSNKLRLNGNGYGSVRDINEEFRPICYTDSGLKKVPKSILNCKDGEVIKSFLDGYSEGDGRVNERFTKRWYEFHTNSPTLAQGVSFLLNKIGNDVGVNYRRNYGKEYIQISNQDFFRSGSRKVDSVEELNYEGDYVYDLQTENQHFGCGVGSIIVHNTDSVFYPARPIVESQMPSVDPDDEEDMTDAILEIADEVEDYLNACYNHFARDLSHIPEDKKHWFEIKQELVAKSGLWIRKKRYAQWIINDEGDPTDELDVKGLDIVRSDFPPAFRELLRDVIVSILKGAGKDEIDDKVLDFREGLRELDLEDVARPTGVGDLDDYKTDDFGRTKKGAPAHFVGALNYNDLITHFGLENEVSPIKGGSKIKWVYLKKNNLGFDKMAFKGQGDPEEIITFLKENTDYVKLYEKGLKSKVESVYEAMDWEFPSENKRQAQKFFSM